MTKEHNSKQFIQTLHREHQEILGHLDELHEALHGLQYEGKIAFGKHMKKIREAAAFLKKELVPHIKIDEEVIFPFLERHIPKLNAIILFLRGEHKEFAENLKSLENILAQVKESSTDDRQQKILTQLREKGIYMVCLMRNHIQTETAGIYKIMDEELRREEQQELMKSVCPQCSSSQLR